MYLHEIRNLMTRPQNRYVDPDWSLVVDRFAERLAAVAHKLTNDEVYSFISFGADLHLRDYRERESKLATELLLKKLRLGDTQANSHNGK